QGKEIEHRGKYLEISRPQFLTFTWEVPQHSSDSSVVRITVELFKEGSKLTLTHKNVLPEYQEATKAGWTKILDNLDKELN
ncbi:MAG: SRPBCC domain-containing protein, partial [Bdellovibrionia bacterium]